MHSVALPWPRLRHAFLAIAGLLVLIGVWVPQKAEARPDYVCWTYQFVPGERQTTEERGVVQAGMLYITSDFVRDEMRFDPALLSQRFEKYVRSTAEGVSSQSLFVSGCNGGATDFSARTLAAAEVAEPNFMRQFHPNYKNQTIVDWAPSAEDLAVSLPAEGAPRFYQCFAHMLQEDKSSYAFDPALLPQTVYRSPLLKAGVPGWRSSLTDTFGRKLIEDFGRGPRRFRCHETASVAQMKNWERFELGVAPGDSKVVDYAFAPEIGQKPVTAVTSSKVPRGAIIIEDRKPAPSGFTPEQLAQTREAAASKAKALAATRRNEADMQVRIKKFVEDMKKRGNAQ